jgi:hypothetical protein
MMLFQPFVLAKLDTYITIMVKYNYLISFILEDDKTEAKIMKPIVIPQTQEETVQSPLRENISSDTFPRTLENTPKMSAAMVSVVQKPLVQLTLYGPRRLAAPFSHIQKHNFKSGIQVKSHVRKARNAPWKFLKNKIKEVPIKDPRLNESVRLAGKIQFDDLMRFREIVFCRKHK